MTEIGQLVLEKLTFVQRDFEVVGFQATEDFFEVFE